MAAGGAAAQPSLPAGRDARERPSTEPDARRTHARSHKPAHERTRAPAHPRTRAPAHYRFTYVLLNPFRVFVTVNVPSARAEILM